LGSAVTLMAMLHAVADLVPPALALLAAAIFAAMAWAERRVH
jgi:hypothetical protein